MAARFALCVALAGCAARESALDQDDSVVIEPGAAVSVWDGAQRLPPLEVGPGEGEGRNLVALPLAGAADGGRPADAAGAPAPSEVVFRVTTLPQGGRYQPKNIGAIWIEDAQGEWVKTLALWAAVRVRYLAAHRAANPTGNRVDAVTSGTLQEHTTHALTWDLTDADGNVVPDGDYQVRVEVTDKDAPGEQTAVDFTKSSDPVVVAPEDTPFFEDVELRYE
jgi:hypothetical protein